MLTFCTVTAATNKQKVAAKDTAKLDRETEELKRKCTYFTLIILMINHNAYLCMLHAHRDYYELCRNVIFIFLILLDIFP